MTYANRTVIRRVVLHGSPWSQFVGLWTGGLARDSPSNLLLPLMGLWFIAITATSTASQTTTYAILGLVSVVMVIVSELVKKRDLLTIVNFGYREVARPMVAGLLVLFVPVLIWMFMSQQFTQTSGTTADKANAFTFNVLILAPVESIFFLWAMTTSWRPGAILSTFLFAADHPIIRNNLGSMPFLTLLGAFFGLVLVAFFLQSVVFLGLVKWAGSAWFGLPFAIGFHAAWNVIVTFFLFSILGYHFGVW